MGTELMRVWLTKYKDYGINAFAFGLYIIMQQMVIMPFLAKWFDDDTFSSVILFVSIFNIICIVLGDELGNTRIIRSRLYKANNLNGDFHIILLGIVSIVFLVGIIINSFLSINWDELLILLIIVALGIIRYFSMSYYKLNIKFKYILNINIAYSVGAGIGLYLASRGYYLAPFLMGELTAGLFIGILVLSSKENRPVMRLTNEFNNTFWTLINLSLMASIVNVLAYLDRIIILPVLGGTAMAIYYSASAMSKMISLIVNPVSGVILAKLTVIEVDKKKELIMKVVRYLIPLIIIFTLASLFASYLGVKIFYNQYFGDAKFLLVPISVATALSLSTFLLKPFLISFYKTKEVMLMHIFYALTFIISMYYFSYWWGIAGFAWANCLSRLVQLLLYFYMSVKGDMVEERICSSDGISIEK